jgi:hypothetical protein
MRKITLVAAVAIALTPLLSFRAPEARADVGISIGIPLPGVAFYAPPVYYAPRAYYPRAYYGPPAYYGYGYGGYGPGYGSVYFGRSWGGHRHHGWHGGRHGRHGRHHRHR